MKLDPDARLRCDWHVHSTFSDDARSSIEENLARAEALGFDEICMVDHVRRSTTWVPDFAAAIARLRLGTGVRITCSVEAKILDRTGALDMPADLAGIDIVHIADHQFPLVDGPASPAEVRRRLADGEATEEELMESLVAATIGALRLRDESLLAHLFSILPKIGLAESAVPAEGIAEIAATARATGARLEINEKWSCPSLATARIFAAAGVPIVPSTDAHHVAEVGVYSSVRPILAALAE